MGDGAGLPKNFAEVKKSNGFVDGAEEGAFMPLSFVDEPVGMLPDDEGGHPGQSGYSNKLGPFPDPVGPTHITRCGPRVHTSSNGSIHSGI